MSHKVNLVRVFTAATGNSTPITLGAAYSSLFMTPAEAGAMDGRVYTYLIVDGNDWEMGRGAYTASGTSLARTTIIASRISGTLGTSRITLTGTAQVRFIESAEDMDGVRGTRAVTSTSDVLANSDQGYVVTYSNAAAIAVSLAQAGASNLFLAGWATKVQNIGAGTVTVTPATSTINGSSTLALASGMGAFIWSDGSNYRAYFIPASKPLLAANNLSDATAATVRSNVAAAGLTVANVFTDTTASSSPTTGSAKFAGGIGVAGAGYFGGGLHAVGSGGSAGASLFLNNTGTGGNHWAIDSSDSSYSEGAGYFLIRKVGALAAFKFTSLGQLYAGLTLSLTGSSEWAIDSTDSGYSEGADKFIIRKVGQYSSAVFSASGMVRFPFYGSGTLQTDASGNMTASSDETLKVIHGNFTRGLDAMSSVQPITYSWNAESGMETEGVYAGFSAQNVQAAIPEAVGVGRDGKLTLQDRAILAAVVTAIKELDARTASLAA